MISQLTWDNIYHRIWYARCVADIYNIEGKMPEDLRKFAEQKLDELSGPYAGSS